MVPNVPVLGVHDIYTTLYQLLHFTSKIGKRVEYLCDANIQTAKDTKSLRHNVLNIQNFIEFANCACVNVRKYSASYISIVWHNVFMWSYSHRELEHFKKQQ